MKTKILISSAVIIGLAVTVFTTDTPSSLPIGAPLPKGEIKMQDVSGKEVALNDSKMTNGLLVVFSCNTCPFVVKHESAILETGKYAKENKIGYVIINSNEAQREGVDSFDAMKKYAEKQGYSFAYTVDASSALADAFGATRTPEAFLFDKNLKLVYKGAFTDDSDPKAAKTFYLKDAISSLRDGKEITMNSTKSVGCTIKRIKTAPKN